MIAKVQHKKVNNMTSDEPNKVELPTLVQPQSLIWHQNIIPDMRLFVNSTPQTSHTKSANLQSAGWGKLTPRLFGTWIIL